MSGSMLDFALVALAAATTVVAVVASEPRRSATLVQSSIAGDRHHEEGADHVGPVQTSTGVRGHDRVFCN